MQGVFIVQLVLTPLPPSRVSLLGEKQIVSRDHKSARVLDHNINDVEAVLLVRCRSNVETVDQYGGSIRGHLG